jgi:hypothetical protein
LGLQIPTTRPHHSAKNKINTSGGTGDYDRCKWKKYED